MQWTTDNTCATHAQQACRHRTDTHRHHDETGAGDLELRLPRGFTTPPPPPPPPPAGGGGGGLKLGRLVPRQTVHAQTVPVQRSDNQPLSGDLLKATDMDTICRLPVATQNRKGFTDIAEFG